MQIHWEAQYDNEGEVSLDCDRRSAFVHYRWGRLQTPAKAPELFKSDVLASIAARDKVFVLRQKMLAQGKTPAKARVGLRSAAKSVLPKAAKYYLIKMIRYARYNESESERTLPITLRSRGMWQESSGRGLREASLLLMRRVVRRSP